MERGEFERIYLRSESAKFHFQRMCLELSRVVREQCAKVSEDYGEHMGPGDGQRAAQIIAGSIRSLQPKVIPPPGHASPFRDEECFTQLIRDYKHIGYGWMMGEISKIWFKEHGGGAFCITDTYNGVAQKRMRCTTEGHDWQPGENPWCDRCNLRADQVDPEGREKCNHEGPANLRCGREAGHEGQHSGGVTGIMKISGMTPVPAVDTEAQKTKEREEARSKALSEVEEHLAMFSCNCDALVKKRPHLANCPLALTYWIQTQISLIGT